MVGLEDDFFPNWVSVTFQVAELFSFKVVRNLDFWVTNFYHWKRVGVDKNVPFFSSKKKHALNKQILKISNFFGRVTEKFD